MKICNMKPVVALVFLVAAFTGCAQKKQPIKGDTEFQKELNAKFKDASTSPLKERDLKTFGGLDFFSFDSTYVVKAYLERTPNSKWFNMKTTTNRVSQERVYGILHFKLKGKPYQLNVYQGKELMANLGLKIICSCLF